MGYGFVGFKGAEGTKRALKSMQGHVLDGHALSVRLAGWGAEEPTEGKVKPDGKSSTKTVVKKVPFEASEKDIGELFGFMVHRSAIFSPFQSLSKSNHSAHGQRDLCAFPRSLTTVHAVSPSSSSLRSTKRRTRSTRSSTPIYSIDIWCYSGRRRSSMMLVR